MIKTAAQATPQARLSGLGRWIVTLVTALIILFALAVALPRVFGYQTFVITSGSMAGTADVGSLVLSHEVPTDDVAVGDVITYVPPAGTGIDYPVTHRVVAIELDEAGQRVFTTQGDANAAPDPWTFQLDSDVQSVMTLAVPGLGRPILVLADPGTRRLAIGIPAMIIAALAFLDIVREVRRSRSTTTAPATAATFTSR